MPSQSPVADEHDHEHEHDHEGAEAGADGAAAGYAHPYYSYAVPPGTPGSPSQSGENGVQVVYPPPPGGYWPPGYMAIPVPMHMPSGGGTSANGKPKRKQVKNACTNCQTACKRCEDARPCARCVKYGLADSCINSARKERKKGIKRGPYKKRKEGGDSGMDVDDNMGMDAMMPPGAAGYHPGALPPGYPEGGYYSYFPGYAFQGGPGHLVPATHDGEEGEEDGEDGERAAVAAAHYYYPYYALPPGAMPPGGERKDDDEGNEEEEGAPQDIPPTPAPAPVATPTPAPKKSRKKAAAGDDGDKPKARGGRKKKAAAAAPPPPPPPGEEDELDPEDEVKDE